MKNRFSVLVAGLLPALALADAAAAKTKTSCATNSVSIVTSEELGVSGTTNVEDALAKLPVVATTSGRSFSFDRGTSQVRIRGRGDGTTNPLIVVDGRPIGTDGYGLNNVNLLDPANIEETTILSGPAAAGLYGTAGSGGVVLITTTRDHKRTAFATENAGTLVNPAVTFTYGLSGTGYDIGIGSCVDAGRLFPLDASVNFSGYDLSGSGNLSGLNFAEGFGVTGVGGLPGVFVNSPTDLLNASLDVNRTGREISLDFGIPLNASAYSGRSLVNGRPPVFSVHERPSIGITSVYFGLRGGGLNQKEQTQFSAFTPAFGLNGNWLGSYDTDFDGRYAGVTFGLGHSRTYFGRRGAATTLSLVGSLGFNRYDFDVSERVDASGLGGALNYTNSQRHEFSDDLFSGSLTASLDWRRDNLNLGGYVSFSNGKAPEINRFLPDSSRVATLDPIYSISAAPSAEIGIYGVYTFSR